MICVAVCTRERPQMLRRMLVSCTEIQKDSRSNLTFVVIENGEVSTAPSIIEEFRTELDIHYVNEPNLGIVNARNSAIEFFLKSDAEWMASFDDDEVVNSGWLIAMLDAIDKYPTCRIFAGPQIRVPPKNESIWFPYQAPKDLETGTKNWNVSTANILFQRHVFAADGLGLRFYPRFNFSGGEDTQIFYSLKDHGEDILWVSEAKCLEPTIDERGTFRAKARRILITAQNWGTIKLMRMGKVRGRLLVIWLMLASALNIFSYAIIGVFVLIGNEKKGLYFLSRSLQSGFESAGYFKSLFSEDGRYYAKTDGH